MNNTDSVYCADLVRQGDYPRYVSVLFAPYGKRPALWALYAFDLEIARIPSTVTQATLGLIRLQWWRDEIERLFDGQKMAHPVLKTLALARGEQGQNWSKEEFMDLLEARERDLTDELFASTEAFLSYCEQVTAPVLRLAQQAAGFPEMAENDLKIIARAYGVARYQAQHQTGHDHIIQIKDFLQQIENSLKNLKVNFSKKSPIYLHKLLLEENVSNLKENILPLMLWWKSF